MFGPLEKVVAWLRTGYPQGIPDGDYLPLFALLRRRLTEDEIEQLRRDLVDQGMVPADRIDVGTGYLGITNELPAVEELHRVTRKLHEAGLEIDDPQWQAPPPASG